MSPRTCKEGLDKYKAHYVACLIVDTFPLTPVEKDVLSLIERVYSVLAEDETDSSLQELIDGYLRLYSDG